MRLVHLADRLSDRGGAYGWLLGLVDALAADHEQRLVVGASDGTPGVACDVIVRPGLELRGAQRVSLDDLAARADVLHLHNVMNPAVLEWAAARTDTLLTIQDHRYFCASRGKWTAAGTVCRRPLTRELCASCFDDGRYFREVQELTERRLAAASRLRVTVLSRYMREELVAAGLAAGRVHVVPPFVHGLDEPGSEAAGDAGGPCVLFVGRLVEAKGVRDALEAWRLSGVSLPLVVAGTGPLRAELEAEAARSAGPPLEVHGWLGPRELARLYRRARALLFPPRWQEPFGIVGLEALSFGVPVVAWESGAVSEWHPGPGLVRWGDVPALATALRQAVTRRITRAPGFERDEALGRLLLLYGRVAGGSGRLGHG
jgi:glycosyltransferase involved in cell wall biosynthesis